MEKIKSPISFWLFWGRSFLAPWYVGKMRKYTYHVRQRDTYSFVNMNGEGHSGRRQVRV